MNIAGAIIVFALTLLIAVLLYDRTRKTGRHAENGSGDYNRRFDELPIPEDRRAEPPGGDRLEQLTATSR
jgi:hypothetical protein